MAWAGFQKSWNWIGNEEPCLRRLVLLAPAWALYICSTLQILTKKWVLFLEHTPLGHIEGRLYSQDAYSKANCSSLTRDTRAWRSSYHWHILRITWPKTSFRLLFTSVRPQSVLQDAYRPRPLLQNSPDCRSPRDRAQSFKVYKGDELYVDLSLEETLAN
jgi:hypothetical protein